MEKSIFVQEPRDWIPVNTGESQVIAIAEFAVKEHDKKTPNELVFVAVVKGWKKGANYNLIIKASNEKVPFPHPYEAVVYEDSSRHLQLVSFEPLITAEGASSDKVVALLKLWQGIENLKPTEVNAAGEINGISHWEIVNPNDPIVIEVGEFAVDEENKNTGSRLVFERVVFGLMAGFLNFDFYALLIQTQEGLCIALVFRASFVIVKTNVLLLFVKI